MHARVRFVVVLIICLLGFSMFPPLALQVEVTESITVKTEKLPTPRSVTSAVYFPLNQKIYILGGVLEDETHYQIFDQIIEYDPSTSAVIIKTEKLPQPRNGFAAVYYPQNGRIYIFGGQGGEHVLEYNPTTASEIQKPETFPDGASRVWLAAAYFPLNKKIYIFGGLRTTFPSYVYDDILEYEPETGTISKVGLLPSPLYDHSAVYVDFDSKIYIFSGADIIEYDPIGRVITERPEKIPDSIKYYPVVYNPEVKSVYTYGGGSGGRYASTIYRYDLTERTITASSVRLPTDRAYASAAYYPPNGRTYIFGGHAGLQPFDDIVEHITLVTGPAPDFEISVSPTSRLTIPEQSTAFTASITSINGFNSIVTLAASVNPISTEVSLTFDPIQVIPPAGGSVQSTLRVTTTGSVERSAYTITIIGSSGEITHSLTVTLKVGKWITDTIDSVGDVGLYASIAIDSRNNVHMSYYDDTNMMLKYAYFDGSWHTTTVDRDKPSGRHSSIALDSNDNPYISYRLGGMIQDELRCAWFDGNYWNIETVDKPWGTIKDTAIALDSKNHPYIVYSTIGIAVGAVMIPHILGFAVKVASFDAGEWHVTQVDTSGVKFAPLIPVAISLDSHDAPHITYFLPFIGELTKGIPIIGELRYAKYEEETWLITTVKWWIGFVIPTNRLSIAIDSNEIPHIIYKYNVYIKHAKMLTFVKAQPICISTWEITDVDSVLATEISPSMAIDSQRRLHISYGDYLNRKAVVKYAVWDGNQWTKDIVDSINGGSRTKVMWTSIALDFDDHPHIGYYDYANGDLKYANLDP